MEQLYQDTTGATWPKLIYKAWAIALETNDGLTSAQQGWELLHLQTELTTADGQIIAALAVPETLAVSAYDVYLPDEAGNRQQPASTLPVSLPVADGAESAIILHILDTHEEIVAAIEAGTAIGLQTTEDMVVIAEVIEPTVANGKASFTATSFSTYYVVSGHTETLKSWWQDSSGGTTEANTRYNVDRSIYGLDSTDTDAQTYYVEPDSTMYLYVKNGTVTNREITENTSNGNISLSAANDEAGLLVKVSGTAVEGQEMTFTVNKQWTVKVIVIADVVESTFNNTDYPVYIGITFDPTTISIANEPRVSGNDTNEWTYVTNLTNLTITGGSSSYRQKDVIAPVSGSKATNYLLASIKDQTFLEGTDDDSVKGLIDTEMQSSDGYPPTVELDNYVYGIDWEAIAEKLLADSGIASKLKATNGVTPTMDNYGEVGGYVLQPYVVKIQTSKYVGWHINAC